MPVPPKNARRCAARATFSLRWVPPIQAIISARSTCMINSALIRTSRFTGATKRFLRRDYVWRRKTSAPRRLPRFTKYWRETRARIGGAKKQKRVLPIFDWSISFGRINRKESVAENLGFLSQIDDE